MGGMLSGGRILRITLMKCWMISAMIGMMLPIIGMMKIGCGGMIGTTGGTCGAGDGKTAGFTCTSQTIFSLPMGISIVTCE